MPLVNDTSCNGKEVFCVNIPIEIYCSENSHFTLTYSGIKRIPMSDSTEIILSIEQIAEILCDMDQENYALKDSLVFLNNWPKMRDSWNNNLKDSDNKSIKKINKMYKFVASVFHFKPLSEDDLSIIRLDDVLNNLNY